MTFYPIIISRKCGQEGENADRRMPAAQQYSVFISECAKKVENDKVTHL